MHLANKAFCVTSLENIECFQLTSIIFYEKIYKMIIYVHPYKKNLSTDKSYFVLNTCHII